MLLAELIHHDLANQKHVLHVINLGALPSSSLPPKSVACVANVSIVVFAAVELALYLLVAAPLRHPARYRSALALNQSEVLKVFMRVEE